MGRKKIIGADEALAELGGGGDLSSLLIDDLNQNYGKIAYSLGEEETPTDITGFVSTGCTVLDTIISNNVPQKLGFTNGGLPMGRLVEIYGDNSTGKSLIVNHVLINTQKMGGIPILFDEENATSIDFLQRMGMKLGQDARDAGMFPPVYGQAGSVEKVFDSIEHIIGKIRDLNIDKPITIAFDSIASCPTNEEVEKGYDEKTMAVKARVLSLAMRKIMPLIGKKKVLLIFTNQIRAKPGVMFGDPTTTPGGYAVPFHSSVRIMLSKNGEIKDKSGNPIGSGVKARIKKNRVSSPGRMCEFSVFFTSGIDDLESCFNNLVTIGEIRKPTTQSYELDFNGQVMKFKTTQWRETVENTPGLEEHIKKMVTEKNVLSLDKETAAINSDTGSVELAADSGLDI